MKSLTKNNRLIFVSANVSPASSARAVERTQSEDEAIRVAMGRSWAVHTTKKVDRRFRAHSFRSCREYLHPWSLPFQCLTSPNRLLEHKGHKNVFYSQCCSSEPLVHTCRYTLYTAAMPIEFLPHYDYRCGSANLPPTIAMPISGRGPTAPSNSHPPPSG